MSASVRWMLGSVSMGVTSSTAFCAEGASFLFAPAVLAFAGGVVCASAGVMAMAMASDARRIFMLCLLSFVSMRAGFEPSRCFGGQLPPGAVRPLEHLPVVAVAGPVLQFPAMTDRRPAGTLGVD